MSIDTIVIGSTLLPVAGYSNRNLPSYHAFLRISGIVPVLFSEAMLLHGYAYQEVLALNVTCTDTTRQRTPGRMARAAALLVGFTPSTCTKIHNMRRCFIIAWQVPAVWATPHGLPMAKSRSTFLFELLLQRLCLR